MASGSSFMFSLNLIACTCEYLFFPFILSRLLHFSFRTKWGWKWGRGERTQLLPYNFLPQTTGFVYQSAPLMSIHATPSTPQRFNGSNLRRLLMLAAAPPPTCPPSRQMVDGLTCLWLSWLVVGGGGGVYVRAWRCGRGRGGGGWGNLIPQGKLWWEGGWEGDREEMGGRESRHAGWLAWTTREEESGRVGAREGVCVNIKEEESFKGKRI